MLREISGNRLSKRVHFEFKEEALEFMRYAGHSLVYVGYDKKDKDMVRFSSFLNQYAQKLNGDAWIKEDCQEVLVLCMAAEPRFVNRLDSIHAEFCMKRMKRAEKENQVEIDMSELLSKRQERSNERFGK